MAFPLIPVLVGGGVLLGLFAMGGTKKEEEKRGSGKLPGVDDDPEPQPTDPDPEPTPAKLPSIPPGSVMSLPLGQGNRAILRFPHSLSNPGAVGMFLRKQVGSKQNGDPIFEPAPAAEIRGVGFSSTEPNREYIVEVNAPGVFHAQAMEGDSFDAPFIAEWTIRATQGNG